MMDMTLEWIAGHRWSPGTTELYRCFDQTDRLLYVGISENVVWRLRRHAQPARGQAWWAEVSYISLERFPTVRTALAAERHAIRVERPLYNKRSAVAA